MAHFNLLNCDFTTEKLAERAEQIGGFIHLNDYYPASTIIDIAQEYVDNYVSDKYIRQLSTDTHPHRLLNDDIAQYLADCYLEDIGQEEDFNGETL